MVSQRAKAARGMSPGIDYFCPEGQSSLWKAAVMRALAGRRSTAVMVQVASDVDKSGKPGFTINSLHCPHSNVIGPNLAAACSDGCLRLLSASGSVETTADGAHAGAVIQVRWNHAGTALATGGEDGSVKTWSASGMLRATVAAGDTPVYALAWSPDSSLVCVLAGTWHDCSMNALCVCVRQEATV